jgi:hypothetical protein
VTWPAARSSCCRRDYSADDEDDVGVGGGDDDGVWLVLMLSPKAICRGTCWWGGRRYRGGKVICHRRDRRLILEIKMVGIVIK